MRYINLFENFQKDMDLNKIHNDAMKLAEEAFLLKRKGEVDKAKEFSEKAFVLEKQAALQAKEKQAGEPTESVLCRSAAALAVDCELYEEGKNLVLKGLEGNPPLEIANELFELYISIQKKLI